MKGIGKFVSRTPYMVTAKVGLAKKSHDPELDEYHKKFEQMEVSIEKLLKDSKVFTEAVVGLLESGAKFSVHFANLFHPVVGEHDLIGKHPGAAKTVKNVDGYQTSMQELKDTLSPELELISSRIVAPAKEFQTVLKLVRKTITKREHKLVDYDRHNNNLTKLRDKKEKTLADEKNLFKLEQDFEIATEEYTALNTALKNDLPQFIMMATQFIDPLFHSFYYMQLNIYYLMMEKVQGYATECKYMTGTSGAEILSSYEEQRTDAWQEVEGLTITKRIASTGKLMAARQNSVLSTSTATSTSTGLARSATTASTSSGLKKVPPAPPSSSSGTFKKKPPPPPPGMSKKTLSTNEPVASAAPPPPYTAGGSPAAAVAAAVKRAPPPPPAPKPKPKPQVAYVIALYDFTAQADGDLDFKTGDKIEIVTRSLSTEDWWTGRINGREGVFPGNYVKDA